jgi:hypothetical protein
MRDDRHPRMRDDRHRRPKNDLRHRLNGHHRLPRNDRLRQAVRRLQRRVAR